MWSRKDRRMTGIPLDDMLCARSHLADEFGIEHTVLAPDDEGGRRLAPRHTARSFDERRHGLAAQCRPCSRSFVGGYVLPQDGVDEFPAQNEITGFIGA